MNNLCGIIAHSAIWPTRARVLAAHEKKESTELDNANFYISAGSGQKILVDKKKFKFTWK